MQKQNKWWILETEHALLLDRVYSESVLRTLITLVPIDA